MNRVTASTAGLVLVSVISLGFYLLGSSEPMAEGSANVPLLDTSGGPGIDSVAEEEEGELRLSAESLAVASIRIEALNPVLVKSTVMAPAEIQSNGYESSVITPRVAAIVVERHARLSEAVEAGTPLVTLFSRDVANAEGDFLVADREWRRVRNLGREVVSARRYLEAQVARSQAEALLRSYGLAQEAIDAVIAAAKDADHSPGEFTLLADQSGTITSDDFRDGELIEPGQTLFEVVDLDTVWVEARVDVNVADNIQAGGAAWFAINGVKREAVVEQVSSTIDEETRTINVRLLAENKDRVLRPGLFVQAEIEASEGAAVLAVPNDALVRSADGDWVLFAQDEDGGLKPVEIERVKVSGDQTVIEGVSPGTRVAMSGAFFLQSEIAKGGFDIHNH